MYNESPHSALPWIIDPVTGKRRHESPNEAWQRHVNEGWKPVHIENALEEFRLEETRTVLRGEIRFHSLLYSNASGLRDYHGQKVRVRYDPRDGSRVWVWSLDRQDRFICEAGRDANVRSYLAESVQERGEQQRLRGQLQRLERKRLEKEAEARKTLELTVVPLTLAQEATADAMLERLGMLEPPRAEVIPLREEEMLAEGKPVRPVFSGPLAEEAWGRWALQNLEALDEEELEQLEVKMEDARFRMLLGLEDETKKMAGQRAV
ncbi:MAG: Mu transposase C-terminal domain-containing protein [Magnetococcus sp. MYC-9]